MAYAISVRSQVWDGGANGADTDDRLFSDLLTLTKILHARNLRLDCLVTPHQMQPILSLWGTVSPP